MRRLENNIKWDWLRIVLLADFDTSGVNLLSCITREIEPYYDKVMYLFTS